MLFPQLLFTIYIIKFFLIWWNAISNSPIKKTLTILTILLILLYGFSSVVYFFARVWWSCGWWSCERVRSFLNRSFIGILSIWIAYNRSFEKKYLYQFKRLLITILLLIGINNFYELPKKISLNIQNTIGNKAEAIKIKTLCTKENEIWSNALGDEYKIHCCTGLHEQVDDSLKQRNQFKCVK